MARELTAIPTRYLGFQFRSRHEARWAFAFNALNIEFQYEPQGFELPDGSWYLPDFLLPQVRLYAEVKPLPPSSVEMEKCRQLACASGMDTLLLVGPPDFRPYDAILVWPIPGETESEISNFLLDIDYHKRKHYDRGRLFGCCGDGFREAQDFSLEYRDAVYRSRAERFEEAA